MVTIVTNLGDIELELDEENTPETYANFIKYIKAGFYNKTIFHRVIKNFVIQGGGFESGMNQKRTYPPIHNEAKKSIKNHRGTIAMARTSDPHSATSQFFINLKDNHFLDHTSETSQGWGYCVFGKVIKGMDIVDKISNEATTNKAGHQDVPVNDIIIEKVILDGKS